MSDNVAIVPRALKALTQLWADSLRYSDPDAQQEFVRKHIHAALACSRLTLFGSAPSTPTRVVIIVAPYVRAELELLDHIDSRIPELPGVAVEVMDVRLIEGMEHFNRIVPGLGKVPQTPIVSVWKDGAMVDSGWGHDAHNKLQMIFA